MGVQLLKATTGARVIAVDTDPRKLEIAKSFGADVVLSSNAGTAEAVRKATAGIGAEVVFDMVGSDATLALGAKSLRAEGRLVIIGLALGTLPVSFFALPYGAEVATSYWGTITELMELVSLARAGKIRMDVETFPLAQAPQVYEKLRRGEIRGRAVIVPRELNDDHTGVHGRDRYGYGLAIPRRQPATRRLRPVSGAQEAARAQLGGFPVDVASLEGVVLTHAHIDHSGYLPRLCKSGYAGPVYCTRGTRDLLKLLLPDAGYLQEEEAHHANKWGYSRHHPALPLYTREDAERCLEQLVPVSFTRLRTRARRQGLVQSCRAHHRILVSKAECRWHFDHVLR